MRKLIFSAAGILLLTGAFLFSACTESKADQSPVEITVYKSPSCGCCKGWVKHLSSNKFDVTVKPMNDVSPMKIQNGIDRSLWSCHTALVDGYVIEGHVPAADIRRLLKERPAIAGLSVPGMVIGSPGMDGPNPRRFNTVAFTKEGSTSVFARH
jgi:hypothetical protein